jgi:two-component system chemotaxis response regulator CheY
MPGPSGVETLSRILAIDPDAFVVIVSSLGTEEAVHECLTTGARSFLQKPFTKDDFIQFMRDLTKAA